MRPRRRKREHHQHPGTSGSRPGTSQSPSPVMSASVKYPQPFQCPQHPQPPRSTANHNSALPNLLDQAELGRLYKPARTSISKESTTRSRRGYFSGSNLSFTCSQRSHRDYFSGSPSGHLNKNWTLTGPCREARTAVSERSSPAQTPPCAALPDVRLDVRAEQPEAAATSRIPRVERPPVVLEIPGGLPKPSEPRRYTDIPSKGFRPPRRGHKRPRTSSPPFPCRPRKRPSSAGRWCEKQRPSYKQKLLTRSRFPSLQQSSIKIALSCDLSIKEVSVTPPRQNLVKGVKQHSIKVIPLPSKRIEIQKT